MGAVGTVAVGFRAEERAGPLGIPGTDEVPRAPVTGGEMPLREGAGTPVEVAEGVLGGPLVSVGASRPPPPRAREGADVGTPDAAILPPRGVAGAGAVPR